MSSYFTFAEQSAHYFARPHTGVPLRPVESAAAWRASELRENSTWRKRLSKREIAEIEEALGRALDTGKKLEELEAGDFLLPTLGPEVARWREETGQGRGFQVVSGVPTHRWSREEAEAFFWCLGLHMGRPGAQNTQGDLLGFVQDTGEDASDPFVRLYRTRSDIAYHCDAADVVGLLCLESAPNGGVSRIASSVSVYNELLKRRPDLAPLLFENFSLDLRNEGRGSGASHLPIPPCRYADKILRTFYHSDYFRSAERHAGVPALSSQARALLDLYEEIGMDPDFRFDMSLEGGDVQWLSNHSTLHGRDGYEDHPDSERRRLLLRLWLSL